MDNLDVDDEIIQFIAEHVVSNIRELEGSLTRVVAYSQLRRRPLTLDLTIEALRDLLPDVKKKEVTPQIIKSTVSEYYSIPVESLLSERRDREIVYTPSGGNVFMPLYAWYSLINASALCLIETTIPRLSMHVEKWKRLIKKDNSFESVIEDIKRRMT